MRVKICGLREVRDVECAVAAGADAVGFVLADGSPRRVDPDQARRLLDAVPEGVQSVAVYAAATTAELDAALRLGVDLVQTTTPLQHRGDRSRLLPVCCDGDDLLAKVGAAAALGGGPVLVDGPRGGGRGECADLARVAAVAWRHPLWLAGGLDPDNVAAAIHRVRPLGVDVSSGVESQRAIKDPSRIHAFVAAARAAARQLTSTVSR